MHRHQTDASVYIGALTLFEYYKGGSEKKTGLNCRPIWDIIVYTYFLMAGKEGE